MTSFDLEMQAALQEAQDIFSERTAFTWTPAGSSARTIKGIFNQAAFVNDFQEVGIQPEYDATLLCDRSQFTSAAGVTLLPDEGDSITADGTAYRIDSLVKDSISVELRLKTP